MKSDTEQLLSVEARQSDKERCPRCNSPRPELHPAMQFEGEVQLCEHKWHRASDAVQQRSGDGQWRFTELVALIKEVRGDHLADSYSSEVHGGAVLACNTLLKYANYLQQTGQSQSNTDESRDG